MVGPGPLSSFTGLPSRGLPAAGCGPASPCRGAFASGGRRGSLLLVVGVDPPTLADPSSGPAAALPTAHLEGKGFLWNARSNVVHVAVATSSGAPRSRSFLSDAGEEIWLRPVCGARASQLQADSLFSAVPEGSVLCLRSSCFHRLKDL